MEFERGQQARSRWGLAAVFVAAMSSAPALALDFDFFGLFGSRESPLTPKTDSLPYRLTVEVVGGDKNITQALQDASNLYRLRTDAPIDAEALVRRAEADLPRLIDALWGAGHYNARVAVEVAGVPLRLEEERTEVAVRAAQKYRAQAIVPVRIMADPGSVFTLRSVRIVDAASGVPCGRRSYRLALSLSRQVTPRDPPISSRGRPALSTTSVLSRGPSSRLQGPSRS